MGLLQNMLQSPSGYQAEDFQRIRDAARENLNAEFGGQRQMLDEELARRGIFSSSIASGRLGDLAGQQARAMTTMETDLLRSMAETMGRDQSLAAQTALDYMNVLQDDEQFQKDVDVRMFQIMEDSRLRGISLSQEQARDIAEKEQFTATLNQNWAIATMESQLRERLGLGQLELDQLRLNNENFWNDKNWLAKLAEIMGNSDLTPEDLRALGIDVPGGGGDGDEFDQSNPFAPPTSGQSRERTVNGKKYYWNASSNTWVTTPPTSQSSDFDPSNPFAPPKPGQPTQRTVDGKKYLWAYVGNLRQWVRVS